MLSNKSVKTSNKDIHRQKTTNKKIKSGKMFGYVQGDKKIPSIWKNISRKYPQRFKITLVSQNDMRELKEYAEKEGLTSQPRKMLILSLDLQNRTPIFPLLLFNLELGLLCTKIYGLLKYTPEKYFNTVVQSAVDARRQSDESFNSIVVAEKTKLLANSSYS